MLIGSSDKTSVSDMTLVGLLKLWVPTGGVLIL